MPGKAGVVWFTGAMRSEHRAPGRRRPEEITERTLRELRLARDTEDEARLRVLEDLYAQLEAELERDLGEADTPGR